MSALEHTVGQLERSSLTGSQQFSFDLGIPGLRARKLARFPYVVVYVPHGDIVDVWRVLHSDRDIPGAFRDDA